MPLHTVFSAVLNMSITASIAILVILLARIMLKRAPKIFSYALWAVVLFRLLCPVSLPSQFSLMGLFPTPTTEAGRIEYVSLNMLKAEVIKALRGESAFSKDLLGSMVSEAEVKCAELQKQFEDAQAAYKEGQAVLHSLEEQYDNVISWADLYDTASLEAKKMIVNCLISRVEVYRDYKLHIDFNIDFEQFCGGLDIVTIAA